MQQYVLWTDLDKLPHLKLAKVLLWLHDRLWTQNNNVENPNPTIFCMRLFFVRITPPARLRRAQQRLKSKKTKALYVCKMMMMLCHSRHTRYVLSVLSVATTTSRYGCERGGKRNNTERHTVESMQSRKIYVRGYNIIRTRRAWDTILRLTYFCLSLSVFWFFDSMRERERKLTERRFHHRRVSVAYFLRIRVGVDTGCYKLYT